MKSCRICYSDETEVELVSPCNCIGTMKYICMNDLSRLNHKKCICGKKLSVARVNQELINEIKRNGEKLLQDIYLAGKFDNMKSIKEGIKHQIRLQQDKYKKLIKRRRRVSFDEYYHRREERRRNQQEPECFEFGNIIGLAIICLMFYALYRSIYHHPYHPSLSSAPTRAPVGSCY